MFGLVIDRGNIVDRAASDALIASGSGWRCQDWSCPLASECGKHFGLTKAYAAMELKPRFARVRPTRDVHGCSHFAPATRDHFAESLGQKRAFRTVSRVEGQA